MFMYFSLLFSMNIKISPIQKYIVFVNHVTIFKWISVIFIFLFIVWIWSMKLWSSVILVSVLTTGWTCVSMWTFSLLFPLVSLNFRSKVGRPTSVSAVTPDWRLTHKKTACILCKKRVLAYQLINVFSVVLFIHSIDWYPLSQDWSLLAESTKLNWFNLNF